MAVVPGVGWRFLRQWWNVPPGDVVLGAVGVDQEDDPDLAGVDDGRDPRVDPVAVGQPVEDVEGHLGRHVLVGMVGAVEHDLGFGLIDPDVVGDLDRPQLASLVAGADRKELDDVGMRGCDGGHLGRQLGVAVIARATWRELGRVRDRGGQQRQHDRGHDQQRGRPGPTGRGG